MPQWPWFYPPLQLHCCRVHHYAFGYYCNLVPPNIQTKGCSVELILNYFSYPSNLGQTIKFVLVGLKGDRT